MAAQILERPRAMTRRERHLLATVLRRVDYLLLAATAALTALGLITIYSATRSFYPAEPTYYLKRQLVFAALGVVVMLVCALVSYRRIEELAWALYGVAIVSLLGVRVIGHSTLGAQREVRLGVFTLQPSEFALIAVIVIVARLVHHHEDALDRRFLAKLLCVAAVPMALIYLQPDLGTTLITTVILLCLLLLAGFKARYLLLLVACGVAVFVVGYHLHLIQSYQLSRLTGFLHQPPPSRCFELPASQQQLCYQLAQSKIAIGAGGFEGSGLFHGVATNTGFVPEAYADFIFAAIGEQLGFVGAVLLMGLYSLLALRLVRAMQLARDSFGRLLCAGTLVFIAFSAFQNIGMTIGLMPITGIPLPFISYGGSALVASFAAIGLVLNVELRRGTLR